MNPLRENRDSASEAGTPAPITRKAAEARPAWERPVYFPEWKALLDLEAIEPATRARYARESIFYLSRCKAAQAGRV
jgi:hypothetical protein